MEVVLLVVILIAVVGGGYVLYNRPPTASSFGLTPDDMVRLSSMVHVGVEGLRPALDNVNTTLGQVSEQARGLQTLGENISSLQDLLRPPKVRGALGELLLGSALAQALPPSAFDEQYRFYDGKIVDAVIKVRDRLVPVDSKFPLEAFQAMAKDEGTSARRRFDHVIKEHVDAVAMYIRPAEGTLSFALMYIPAEAVYYEAAVAQGSEELRSYAASKRVIFVSPSTLYAYLEVIAFGLKGLEVEGRAQAILEHLETLKNGLEDLQEDVDVTGKHLVNATQRHARIVQGLSRFGLLLERSTSGK